MRVDFSPKTITKIISFQLEFRLGKTTFLIGYSKFSLCIGQDRSGWFTFGVSSVATTTLISLALSV